MQAFEIRLEVLREHLQRSEASIRAYDDLVFKVKGFAVTACAAATLFAIEKQQAIMYLVAILAALGFGLMDAHMKAIQRIFIMRASAIEKFFRDSDLDKAILSQSLDGFNLRTADEILATRSFYKSLWQEILRFHTFYLYVSVVLLILLVAIIDTLL